MSNEVLLQAVGEVLADIRKELEQRIDAIPVPVEPVSPDICKADVESLIAELKQEADAKIQTLEADISEKLQALDGAGD
ncbi:MAG: hypothetical protein ACO25T_09505, partial [Arenimonas sp.]|uniref:hypothetical protein n=1 Tax=Arenimonas sp. TaxID=1872635 RepID=UPI003BFD589F